MVVLVPCCAWKCVSQLCMFLRLMDVIYYKKLVLSDGHKNCFKDWFLINSLTTWLEPFFNKMILLTEAGKPDNLKSHNFLKPSFTNIWGFRSKWIQCYFGLWGLCSMWIQYESDVYCYLMWIFLRIELLTFLLYVSQTWMSQLTLAVSHCGDIFL